MQVGRAQRQPGFGGQPEPGAARGRQRGERIAVGVEQRAEHRIGEAGAGQQEEGVVGFQGPDSIAAPGGAAM